MKPSLSSWTSLLLAIAQEYTFYLSAWSSCESRGSSWHFCGVQGLSCTLESFFNTLAGLGHCSKR
ncbi:uncharacterized protein STEHIDRAFT_120677 [Stereum hirsutum FP-91666 SS1]|uniref:uncharacterized protein n=1 Tax=Stereum hirsutum (strain FP-91666) TaxID=721885 RepID=UPI000440CD98|nr:uncharacterized protein STEHIDRAFT_120677 [Stereum hirsutum FP-91666 SS1]EIM88522.1 hypothetical protein STEHIDRAFT_120677 [Stereum hirsutum FP-91666 SS1]